MAARAESPIATADVPASIGDVEKTAAATGPNELSKGLKSRHMQMLAIGECFLSIQYWSNDLTKLTEGLLTTS